MKTIDELIEMLHALYTYPRKFNMTTPAYRKFHTALTEYIHVKKLDDTEEWCIIKPLLLIRSTQYMISREADRILEALESLKRKSLKGEESFWNYVHPTIKSVCIANFEAGQYADAVSNAFTEIESIVRREFKQLSGEEISSASGLMQKVFKEEPPHFVFENLDTQSGKDVQTGYRFMFAGAMFAIRNPKAHENLHLSKEEAIERLFFSSMLFKKFLNAKAVDI